MKCVKKHMQHRFTKTSFFSLAFLIVSRCVAAQDGKKGIQDATALVESYFTVAQTLLYAIGGIVGIVGAVKVYNKWSHGDQDTNKTAASWFGACIFLVMVATVLKAFFGLK